MGWHTTKRHTKAHKRRHVALYMGGERGFLGDERWYTKVELGFKLCSCIVFFSYNKEWVFLCGYMFNGGVEPH